MQVHSDWLLTVERGAIHLPSATVVIADLHLGYDQARRAGGEAVPVSTLEDSLAPLQRLQAQHQVHRLVVAGDLCEAARHAPIEDLTRWLDRHEWELVGIAPGNHDHGLAARAPGLPLHPEGVQLGRWLIVHGEAKLPAGPFVCGHFHPCVHFKGQVTAPCYLVGPEQLVLPAFSPEAAGVQVLREPRWAGYRCVAIGGDRLLDFGELGRLRDRLKR